MVEPVQDQARADRTGRWAWPQVWRLQPEGAVRPRLVVVGRVFSQHGRQVLFVEHDQVVEALAAEGPDHALGDSIRLWRVQRGRDGVDADAPGTLAEVAPVDRVAIPEQMAWLASPGRRLDDLMISGGKR